MSYVFDAKRYDRAQFRCGDCISTDTYARLTDAVPLRPTIHRAGLVSRCDGESSAAG
jgi:hypothetical protein